MVNFNGILVIADNNLLVNNRAFQYGDGVFETIKMVENKILFLEDHYFRLMASMRIVRMEIPMNFTLDFFEAQIKLVANANHCANCGRVRITVYRNSAGYYLPENNSVNYLIQAKELHETNYVIDSLPYEVDLYKDFFISKQLISTLKTTNRIINITGSIYAKENGLENCLLLNDQKNVVEALQGNIFMLSGHKLITPPLSDGCLNGVMRKQILGLANKLDGIEVFEESISPFELQKADELFITNVIKGIQPITKYRKKVFQIKLAQELLVNLNNFIKLD